MIEDKGGARGSDWFSPRRTSLSAVGAVDGPTWCLGTWTRRLLAPSPCSAHQARSRTCSPPTAPGSSSTNLRCRRKLEIVNVSCNSRPQCPHLGLWPWRCPGGRRQDTLRESVSHSALFLWGRTLSWPLVAQVPGMFRTQLTQGPDRSWWTTTTHLESRTELNSSSVLFSAGFQKTHTDYPLGIRHVLATRNTVVSQGGRTSVLLNLTF